MQYVRIGRGLGDWTTTPGTSASEVGIAPYFRRPMSLQAAGQTQVLESTALDVWDWWTVKGFDIKTTGGGVQWLARPESWIGA